MTALEQLAIMEHESLEIEKQNGHSRELLLIRCIITFLKLYIQQTAKGGKHDYAI